MGRKEIMGKKTNRNRREWDRIQLGIRGSAKTHQFYNRMSLITISCSISDQ